MLSVNQKENVMFFNVDVTRLKKPLENRGLSFVKNKDGTVTVGGNVFDRESDLEKYLESIPRKDFN
jgi:hypothetical protein